MVSKIEWHKVEKNDRKNRLHRHVGFKIARKRVENKKNKSIECNFFNHRYLPIPTKQKNKNTKLSKIIKIWKDGLIKYITLLIKVSIYNPKHHH